MAINLKYPVLLIHGLNGRDHEKSSYWGRIPEALQAEGVQVYFGGGHAWTTIEYNGAIIAETLRCLIESGACEKVNIIAHSKGGLDCRYAMEHLGISQYVASLSTINTPHRGCVFADELLGKVPQKIQDKIATTYNNTMRQLGDPNPDFMAAVRDLTSSHCTRFDAETPQPKGVFCQSIGSLLYSRSRGTFPLNLFYRYVKRFDGPNDGLVGADSFTWGENFQMITTGDKRGISHIDIIDLTRENLPKFDVREFYVRLVSDLKNRGL